MPLPSFYMKVQHSDSASLPSHPLLPLVYPVLESYSDMEALARIITPGRLHDANLISSITYVPGGDLLSRHI